MDKQFVQKRMMEYARDSEKSMRDISAKMGHSHSYLNNITKGRSAPSLDELLYFCNYLEIEPADFFRKEPLSLQQQVAIKKMLGLPPQQLDLLIRLMDQLKTQS